MEDKCKRKGYGRRKWRKLISDFGCKENQKERSSWQFQALHWWMEHKQHKLLDRESLFLCGPVS